jgi:hypothetical protein
MGAGSDHASDVFHASRHAGRAMASELSRWAIESNADTRLDARVVIEAAIEFLQDTIARSGAPQPPAADEPPEGEVLG